MRFAPLLVVSVLATGANASPQQPAEIGSGSWLSSGVLTEPSTAPAEAIAAAYLDEAMPTLAGNAELRLTQLHENGDGHFVVFEQRHRGLSVRGARAVVRVDELGRVRWSANHLVEVDALSATPLLSPGAALRRAGIETKAQHQLVVYAADESSPRLAFEVTIEESPLERIRTWVDADTGRILGRTNLVMNAARHTARVFEQNPLSTPELSTVELSWIPDDADELIAPGIEAKICIDDIDYTTDCRTQPVIADATGSFTEYDYTSDVDYGDDFAAIQAFYHVARAREYASFLGLDALETEIKVNYAPTYGACSPVEGDAEMPFDNAFFDGDHSLVFGQGAEVDFAYDGDVAIHEFGHAIKAHLGGEQLGDHDALGTNHVPRAVGEAYADYLTLALTNDPKIAEYALGNREPWNGIIPARDLEAQRRTCSGMVGEPHEDSLILSSALYAARRTLAASGANIAAYDRAILSTQRALTGRESFERVAAIITAEVEASVGNEAGTAVEHELNANGLFDCDRIIPVERGAAHRLVMLSVTPNDPSTLQLAFEVTKAVEEIEISFTPVVLATCEGSPVGRASVLFKKDEPILWQFDDGNDMAHDAEHMLTVAAEDGARAVVTLHGPLEPGTYYIQLTSDVAVAVADIEVDSTETTEVGGCRTVGGTTSGMWLALAGLFFLLRRRSALGRS